jgi:hypothetical protein
VEGAKAASGAVPVPVRLAVCVLPVEPPELSVTLSVAVRLPFVAGEKVTLITQLAPALKFPTQFWLGTNSLFAVMAVTTSVELPVLLKVTFCAALVLPTA